MHLWSLLGEKVVEGKRRFKRRWRPDDPATPDDVLTATEAAAKATAAGYPMTKYTLLRMLDPTATHHDFPTREKLEGLAFLADQPLAAIVAARATDMGLFDNWLSDMVKAALDKVAAGADPRDLSVVHRRRVTVHPTGDPNMVVFLAAPEGEVTTDAMVVEMAARSAELDAEDATRATGTATVVSLPRQGARKRHQADAVDSPPRESTMES